MPQQRPNDPDLHTELIKIRRKYGDLYPILIGTCEKCGRRRAYNNAIHGGARCPCTHLISTRRKRETLLIDLLEPALRAMPYRDGVLPAYRETETQPFTAVGLPFNGHEWQFVSFGKLPLGDQTPTYLYLFHFADWHGEEFLKVGIGLQSRLRDHERQGARLLEAHQMPRWRALMLERLVLAEWPRTRPSVALPQSGDTECLPIEVLGKIRLKDSITRYGPSLDLADAAGDT